MKYKIANLIVEYEPRFDFLKNNLQKYIIDDCEEKVDIEISITDDQIAKLEESCLKKFYKNVPIAEIIEYLEVGKEFYTQLLKYNGCLLHASAIVIDDDAYLFSADSGVGKTTHTDLWLKYFSSKKPYIINADKPAIKIEGENIYVYGTPFSGEYNINENKKAKLKAITFLEQAETNYIRKLKFDESLDLFFNQSIKLLNKNQVAEFLTIFDKIMKKVPMYKMCCNISKEAAMMSYKVMKGET